MSARVSIGSYYSVASPIHELDPRVKLVATVLYMVSCLLVSSLATLALAGVFVGMAIAAARVPAGRLFAQIRPVAAFLVITSLFNLFFVHTGTLVVSAGPIHIYLGGISAAALYTMRFLFLLLMGSLLMLTTQPVALTDAAEKLLAPLERVGAPVGESMLVLSIALRFLPTLAQDARTISNAQIARGAKLEGTHFRDRIRAFIPLAVPLFSAAIRHAENLARAMDARCFTGDAGRTHYHLMRLDARRDGTAIAVLALYLVLLAALTFA